ncbi:SRPBCC domain-containing protein [Streptomyces bohaiensis]|uniref:Serine/arginine repetitive matrix protein 1 n=1 Tax=Streptomyces bohaiensis TaxID=1431344 RepID=A0ABX1CDW8_9ACTN|nr:SRPBCC domain-containing protein [Streptomyces bohaiensis]NJQ16308.1 serine/arginine repetitive matrix protein 1 [Streptomyces bohaiensis]
MEHEIFVPFPATAVRAALAEQERVARCVPGFQVEPGDDPDALAGRLRLRIGGSTITYRGTVTLTGRGEGVDVDAVASEARGNGTVRVRLTVVPRPVEDGSGTTLSYTGSTEATGRLAEVEPAQRETAARRLLDRFTEALVGEIDATEPPAAEPRDDDDQRAIPGIPGPGKGEGGPSRADAAAASPAGDSAPDDDSSSEESREGTGDGDAAPAETADDAGKGDRGAADDAADDADTAGEPGASSGTHEADGDADGEGDAKPAADTDAEPDHQADADSDSDADTTDSDTDTDTTETAPTGDGADADSADQPPRGAGEVGNRDPHLDAAEAEADRKAREARDAGSVPEHDDDADPLDAQPPYAPEADLARRTMIGRSAEEVDHAPPRGRYAPQPAPGDTGAARLTLKWAAPAAAIAVAGAVAIGRVFRRRR